MAGVTVRSRGITADRGADIITGQLPASATNVINTEPVLASAYGVSASNADNTSALNAAATAAGNGTLVLPRGTLTFSGQVTFTCNVRGQGKIGTHLNCTGAGLTSTQPAVVFSPSTNYYYQLHGFSLQGPGANTLGVKTANCWGMQINNAVFMEHIKISGFDAGLILNAAGGHVWVGMGCDISANYYGVYNILNNSDFYFHDCMVNGNSFANFATPADQGFASMQITRAHVGFAPYAFYQEPTPAAQGTNKVFLGSGVEIIHADFEAIGNAAIYSDATDTSSNFSQISDLLIVHPGFSWNTGYKIGTRPYDYCVKVGHTNRNITIIDGPYPFLAAGTGIFYANTAQHNAWTRVGANPQQSDLAIGTGAKNYYAGSRLLTPQDIPNVTAPPLAGFALPPVGGASGNSCQPANAAITACAVFVPTPATAVSILLNVQNAATAGGVCRVGIYNDNGSWVPGTLLLDAGTIDPTVVGDKSATISVALAPGLYWLVGVTQGAPTTLPRYLAVDRPGAYQMNSASSPWVYGAGWYNTGAAVTGALPASFPSVGVRPGAVRGSYDVIALALGF